MKIFCSFLIIIFCSSSLLSQKNKKPKLVVGIVIDQMCYEYLYRYQSKFSQNGFLKLMNNGTHCRNTHYNYVPTYTGPGHASIYTGTTPSNHAIVANDWYDRSTGLLMNCVDDSTVIGVGSNSDEGKCSPFNLKVNTITDQLKLTYSNSKVISMSIKDRGAILPGGHLSNGSYWFDYATGQFITSTFYKEQLPFWIENFNSQKQPDYGKPNYDLFTFTPFANTYLTNFAIESIYNEMLGQDNQTDMLCISYSTPDIAGHKFGPYSVELEDIYIRLDLEIARLISELEQKVGKDEFVLFLTADHAVVPVPQYLIDKKLPGGYVYKEDKLLELNDAIKQKFNADLILKEMNNNIYLDQETIHQLNIDSKEVEAFIAQEISRWEGVKAVFTTSDFLQNSNNSNWSEMVGLGYFPSKSGEVIFILQPGFLAKSTDSELGHKGTSHGSAFNYDSHVPLIWYGKGIKKQEIFRNINITDITATLTHILFLQTPNATTGQPIVEILTK
ncbi:MAG: alkaline phosphatase family protein [Flavobacteriia bacterium]|nr:alkaline phosphatase family protein [Flavobacteriia bacterium]